jgi:DnaJ like chaperone protein
MNLGGKLLGATVGWVALGPIGAILGAVLGHQFDMAAGHPLSDPVPDPAQINRLFFPATFRVMGFVAKADGRVSEQEIQAARSVMTALRLGADQQLAAIEHFTFGKQTGFNVERELEPLRAALLFFPELAQLFVEIQLQAAILGNDINAAARVRLRRVATLLDVNESEFAQLEYLLRARMRGAWGGAGAGGRGYNGGAGAGYGAGQGSAGARGANRSQSQLAEDYAQLGVAATCSNEEMVKAYRRMMSKNHPDKLRANGLPESMMEHAKERTQQIRAAYERLCEARGIRS